MSDGRAVTKRPESFGMVRSRPAVARWGPEFGIPERLYVRLLGAPARMRGTCRFGFLGLEIPDKNRTDAFLQVCL